MKKHLNFYKKCMKTGYLPDTLLSGGLCNYAKLGELNLEFLKLFKPTDDDEKVLKKNGLCTVYWASGISNLDTSHEQSHKFTNLRQTIVLFLAAMDEYGVELDNTLVD